MIDIKAIKQAAIDSDETGFASVLTNNDTVIALCDEIERLRADSARLVAAIKSDRHDWEDWPTASREAFKAMEAK